MFQQKIILLLFASPIFGLDKNLVFDFFTKIKVVSHLVVFTCGEQITGL